MVPIDILIGTIYDHLKELVPELDELLNVPLGVHPQNTPAAKRARAEAFRKAASGEF